MPFSQDFRRYLGKKRGWKCEYPGCSRKWVDGFLLEFHHKIPSSAGGTDSEENVEILCLEHHYKRHTQLEHMGIGHKSAEIVMARWNKTKGRR